MLLVCSVGRADSPFRLSPVKDSLILSLAAAGTVLPYAFASKLITPRCPCSPSEVNSFDRPIIGNDSRAADLTSHATVALAVGLFPALHWNVPDLVVYLEAVMVSGAVVALVKHSFPRPLPKTYTGQLVNESEGYRSFYSGHTSTAVSALSAAATIRELRGEGRWWDWALVAGGGVLVSTQRILAGTHFYTDCLVGMGAGAALGAMVPWLRAHGGAVALVPREEGAELLLAWSI